MLQLKEVTAALLPSKNNLLTMSVYGTPGGTKPQGRPVPRVLPSPLFPEPGSAFTCDYNGCLENFTLADSTSWKGTVDSAIVCPRVSGGGVGARLGQPLFLGTQK